MKKHPVMTSQFPGKCTIVIRTPFIWSKFQSTRSRIAFLADKVTYNNRTQFGAGRVHLQSNLSEGRSHTVRRTLNPTTRTEWWHWKATGIQQQQQRLSGDVSSSGKLVAVETWKRDVQGHTTGWSDQLKESCAEFCVICRQKATVRNRSSIWRSISMYHLTRRRTDERNQQKVGKVENWIIQKIPSWRFEGKKWHDLQWRIKSRHLRYGQRGADRNGTGLGDYSVSFFLEARTRRIEHVSMWHLASTQSKHDGPSQRNICSLENSVLRTAVNLSRGKKART